ncbi:uncharacterized protein LOC62_02G002571 [Vanrija pseudolonga]|uniref:Uncharacterized protein n=1 Tax=Vanrija pseudolonga TaxID=143232 RepID=A0AAF1BK10_9TREE|nr:hypothetical protein LOC62_02G002571 [Vanrija pseudolonga]
MSRPPTAQRPSWAHTANTTGSPTPADEYIALPAYSDVADSDDDIGHDATTSGGNHGTGQAIHGDDRLDEEEDATDKEDDQIDETDDELDELDETDDKENEQSEDEEDAQSAEEEDELDDDELDEAEVESHTRDVNAAHGQGRVHTASTTPGASNHRIPRSSNRSEVPAAPRAMFNLAEARAGNRGHAFAGFRDTMGCNSVVDLDDNEDDEDDAVKPLARHRAPTPPQPAPVHPPAPATRPSQTRAFGSYIAPPRHERLAAAEGASAPSARSDSRSGGRDMMRIGALVDPDVVAALPDTRPRLSWAGRSNISGGTPTTGFAIASSSTSPYITIGPSPLVSTAPGDASPPRRTPSPAGSFEKYVKDENPDLSLTPPHRAISPCEEAELSTGSVLGRSYAFAAENPGFGGSGGTRASGVDDDDEMKGGRPPLFLPATGSKGKETLGGSGGWVGSGKSNVGSLFSPAGKGKGKEKLGGSAGWLPSGPSNPGSLFKPASGAKVKGKGKESLEWSGSSVPSGPLNLGSATGGPSDFGGTLVGGAGDDDKMEGGSPPLFSTASGDTLTGGAVDDDSMEGSHPPLFSSASVAREPQTFAGWAGFMAAGPSHLATAMGSHNAPRARAPTASEDEGRFAFGPRHLPQVNTGRSAYPLSPDTEPVELAAEGVSDASESEMPTATATPATAAAPDDDHRDPRDATPSLDIDSGSDPLSALTSSPLTPRPSITRLDTDGLSELNSSPATSERRLAPSDDGAIEVPGGVEAGTEELSVHPGPPAQGEASSAHQIGAGEPTVTGTPPRLTGEEVDGTTAPQVDNAAEIGVEGSEAAVELAGESPAAVSTADDDIRDDGRRLAKTVTPEPTAEPLPTAEGDKEVVPPADGAGAEANAPGEGEGGAAPEEPGAEVIENGGAEGEGERAPDAEAVEGARRNDNGKRTGDELTPRAKRNRRQKRPRRARQALDDEEEAMNVTAPPAAPAIAVKPAIEDCNVPRCTCPHKRRMRKNATTVPIGGWKTAAPCGLCRCCTTSMLTHVVTNLPVAAFPPLPAFGESAILRTALAIPNGQGTRSDSATFTNIAASGHALLEGVVWEIVNTFGELTGKQRMRLVGYIVRLPVLRLLTSKLKLDEQVIGGPYGPGNYKTEADIFRAAVYALVQDKQWEGASSYLIPAFTPLLQWLRHELSVGRIA